MVGVEAPLVSLLLNVSMLVVAAPERPSAFGRLLSPIVHLTYALTRRQAGTLGRVRIGQSFLGQQLGEAMRVL